MASKQKLSSRSPGIERKADRRKSVKRKTLKGKERTPEYEEPSEYGSGAANTKSTQRIVQSSGIDQISRLDLDIPIPLPGSNHSSTPKVKGHASQSAFQYVQMGTGKGQSDVQHSYQNVQTNVTTQKVKYVVEEGDSGTELSPQALDLSYDTPRNQNNLIRMVAQETYDVPKAQISMGTGDMVYDEPKRNILDESYDILKSDQTKHSQPQSPLLNSHQPLTRTYDINDSPSVYELYDAMPRLRQRNKDSEGERPLSFASTSSNVSERSADTSADSTGLDVDIPSRLLPDRTSFSHLTLREKIATMDRFIPAPNPDIYEESPYQNLNFNLLRPATKRDRDSNQKRESIVFVEGDSDNSYDTWPEDSGYTEEGDEEDEDVVVIEEPRVYVNIEEEEKMKDKRYHIVCEIASTEEVYCSRLEILRKAKEGAVKIINEDVAKQMFPNIEGMCQLHCVTLLPRLQERVKNWDKDKRIGDIIKYVAPFMKLYTDYITNYDNAVKLVDNWDAKSADFSRMLKAVDSTGNPNSLQVKAHMLEPIQRIPRYELLLKQYLKQLPEGYPDKEDVEKSLELISEVAKHFETMIGHESNMEQLVDLQYQLVSPFSIVSTSRKLIKEGRLNKVCKTGKPVSRYAFLFNDMFMLCKEQSIMLQSLTPKYRYKQILPIAGMEIGDGDSVDMPYLFSLKTKRMTLELCADSEEEKWEWQRELWNVVRKNTKNRSRRPQSYSVALDQTAGKEECKLGKEAPLWVKNNQVSMCMLCASEFKNLKRKHHCRACGKVVCHKCSTHSARLEYDQFRLHRVCDECYQFLTSSSTSPNKKHVKARSQQLCINRGFLYIHNPDKKWIKRWVELHEGGYLHAFKAQQDIVANMSIALNECQATIVKIEGYKCILLDNNSGKQFIFREETLDTASLGRWLESFETAIGDADGLTSQLTARNNRLSMPNISEVQKSHRMTQSQPANSRFLSDPGVGYSSSPPGSRRSRENRSKSLHNARASVMIGVGAGAVGDGTIVPLKETNIDDVLNEGMSGLNSVHASQIQHGFTDSARLGASLPPQRRSKQLYQHDTYNQTSTNTFNRGTKYSKTLPSRRYPKPVQDETVNNNNSKKDLTLSRVNRSSSHDSALDNALENAPVKDRKPTIIGTMSKTVTDIDDVIPLDKNITLRGSKQGKDTSVKTDQTTKGAVSKSVLGTMSKTVTDLVGVMATAKDAMSVSLNQAKGKSIVPTVGAVSKTVQYSDKISPSQKKSIESPSSKSVTSVNILRTKGKNSIESMSKIETNIDDVLIDSETDERNDQLSEMKEKDLKKVRRKSNLGRASMKMVKPIDF